MKAKRGGPAELQVFTNLTLGKTWRTSINRLSADVLAGRVEPIGLERIPEEIVLLTCGADVQDDRVEACVVGWPLAGRPVRARPRDHRRQHARRSDLARSRRVSHDPLAPPARLGDQDRRHGDRTRAATKAGRKRSMTSPARGCIAGFTPFAASAGRGRSGPGRSASSRGKTARLFILAHDQVKTAVLELLSAEPFDVEGNPNPHALRVTRRTAARNGSIR